uniref:hypothetical protein n=1 Tax=Clostridioides sp. ES-S-0173-01 TaxID=2770786 RepID=UPI001E32EFB5|nr:hypothetical protein [Clostridioides sp. ES-S-0173-01]UDN49499.1 hypothetical protein JJJ25_19490 [Clostridioides sp. ES-S-0173-01]
MQKIAAGEKYPVNVGNGLSITFDDTGFTTIFKTNKLSEKNILGFREGDLRIDISFLNKIIFFTFTNTTCIGYEDIPFTIHLTKCKETRYIKENEGYLMNLILVDDNNIVKGFRAISFTHKASKYIKKYIDEQLLEDFNKEEYIKKVRALQDKYDTKDIKGMSVAYTKFQR